MVPTELDKPADLLNYPCKLCGKPLARVEHFWVLNRWMHISVHNRCAEEWSRVKAAPKRELKIPERFQSFDNRLANGEAARLCGAFSPQSNVKTLAILGLPGQGKSRLLWETAKTFMEDLGHGELVPFQFEALITEFDKSNFIKLSQARYVLLDDVGSCESYGRERAALQAALRSRIKRGDLWTFLTIDNLSFDPELEHVFKGRALIVTL
jgi:DNA replication protein DnaC